MSNITIRRIVMKRVNRIHFLRTYVVNAFSFKCSILLALLAGVVSLVSMGDVVANMPKAIEAGAIFYFSKYAFMQTGLMVQTLLIGTTGVILWMAKDLVDYTLNVSTRKVVHY